MTKKLKNYDIHSFTKGMYNHTYDMDNKKAAGAALTTFL